ncbi:hypothetical protein JOC34_002249 [Virgibacillus halotolerans]|nr:hypothetical protein [Virgibacillus halotolerans]
MREWSAWMREWSARTRERVGTSVARPVISYFHPLTHPHIVFLLKAKDPVLLSLS